MTFKTDFNIISFLHAFIKVVQHFSVDRIFNNKCQLGENLHILKGNDNTNIDAVSRMLHPHTTSFL